MKTRIVKYLEEFKIENEGESNLSLEEDPEHDRATTTPTGDWLLSNLNSQEI